MHAFSGLPIIINLFGEAWLNEPTEFNHAKKRGRAKKLTAMAGEFSIVYDFIFKWFSTLQTS